MRSAFVLGVGNKGYKGAAYLRITGHIEYLMGQSAISANQEQNAVSVVQWSFILICLKCNKLTFFRYEYGLESEGSYFDLKLPVRESCEFWYGPSDA